MTPERREELSAVLARHDVLIIEDDGTGDISERPLLSLGEQLPEQTILIRSFSKSHGPDLRIAVIGSHLQRPIELARSTLNYGAGWVSRILQNSSAFLLNDSATCAAVTVARETYAARRTVLAEALAAHGIFPLSHDGLVMAIPVRDDAGAQLVLAAHGYAVTSSELARIKRLQPFIRVTVGALEDDQIPHLANAIAVAANAPSPHLP